MLFGLLGAFGLLFVGAAQAATVVALGASNTYGKGVSRGQAYPAQLEALLRARGLNARVVNAGINGNTTSEMSVRWNSAVQKGHERCHPTARGQRQTKVSTRPDCRD
jgi:acyl-CoA thioesterase-1